MSDPLLLGPDEGEVIGDSPERTVVVKADRPELVLCEFRYAAGETGPSEHIHREHADCFFVLDGALTVRLGDETHTLGPGGFAQAPPGVVHTFRNDGRGDARFLNIHAPGCGFAAHLRGEKDDFDQTDPPEDGGRPASDALLVGRGEGESLSLGPASLEFKAQAHDDPGSLSLADFTIPPDFPGPVPHSHRRFVDSFWVLAGTVGLHLGERTVEAGPGSYALAPPGAVHTFSNRGPSRRACSI